MIISNPQKRRWLFIKKPIVKHTKKFRKNKTRNLYQHLKPTQKTTLVNEHLRSHFKILASNFKNYFEQIHTKVYFIETLRRTSNIQKDENYFVLYSKMGSPKFCKHKKPKNHKKTFVSSKYCSSSHLCYFLKNITLVR